MAHTPPLEYDVQVTPVETGYVVSIEGLRQFVVADGYVGTLDDAVRSLIAGEVGVPVTSITVHLRYDVMKKYRRGPTFNWWIVLLGLGALVLAALGLVFENSTLASVAGFGAFVLVVVRLVGVDDEFR